MQYILWSTRANGWMTRGATYVSDRTKAKIFEEDEAFDQCRLHRNNGYSELGLLPVAINDIVRILA